MTLSEEFPKQQSRLRELIAVYEHLGPPGVVGKMMLEDVLQRADKAASEQDIVAMVRLYKEMMECQ